MVELMKIPTEKRPPQYAQLIAGQVKANDLRGAFPLPATWTFYDREVEAFLAEIWPELENREERKFDAT